MSKLFIFVDESGDPGNLLEKNSSSYYQLSIITADETGVYEITKELSQLKYFLNLRKELKEYWYQDKIRPKIINVIELVLSQNPNIKAFTFHIDKEKYKGPYLSTNPVKFRNFIIRKCLQDVFMTTIDHKLFDSIELVIDRYLDSVVEQDHLRKYLHNSYKLPRSKVHTSKLHHIVHVQSIYSDPIQFVDIIGRYQLDGKSIINTVIVKDISDMKKGSDIHQGHQTFFAYDP